MIIGHENNPEIHFTRASPNRPYDHGRLTVGVTTRNRPDCLLRCLESLMVLEPGLAEVIVIDDASDPPVEPFVQERVGERLPYRVIRQETNLGYIVGRNEIMRLAGTEQVLLLDDDTRILDPQSVWRAVATLGWDPMLAAVAFAQAEGDGQPWPAETQPASVDYPCYVPTFIGFAHLICRKIFLELGGYRELFHYYGEEKEFCLRALDAGYRVAFLPASRIAHLPDSNGRDQIKYFRYYTRNDCLAALFTFPWPPAIVRVTGRVIWYHDTLRKHLGISDFDGRRWLVHELWAAWWEIWQKRQVVRWRTLREWRQVRRTYPKYLSPCRTEE